MITETAALSGWIGRQADMQASLDGTSAQLAELAEMERRLNETMARNQSRIDSAISPILGALMARFNLVMIDAIDFDNESTAQVPEQHLQLLSGGGDVQVTPIIRPESVQPAAAAAG